MECTIPNCHNIANPDNVAPDGVHCDTCRANIQANYPAFEAKYGDPRTAYTRVLQALNAYLGEQARLTAAVITWMGSGFELGGRGIYGDTLTENTELVQCISLDQSVRISVQAAYSK